MTAALTPEQRIEALEASLKAANSQAEHFEREWYLRGDRVEALEAELAILRDSECDKIMAMSETQINALTRIQGSNPEDIAQLGRMTARAAIKDVEINRLRAELAACKRDAERYRWLTDDHADADMRGRVDDIAHHIQIRGKGNSDAAIDAAMAAGEKA